MQKFKIFIFFIVSLSLNLAHAQATTTWTQSDNTDSIMVDWTSPDTYSFGIYDIMSEPSTANHLHLLEGAENFQPFDIMFTGGSWFATELGVGNIPTGPGLVLGSEKFDFYAYDPVTDLYSTNYVLSGGGTTWTLTWAALNSSIMVNDVVPAPLPAGIMFMASGIIMIFMSTRRSWQGNQQS